MKQHQKKAAGFIAAAFALTVLLISATTSFGFFYTFFDELIPAGIIDPFLAALISGFVGVLLFDLACAIWLYTFLHDAETPEQRAISLIMTLITFVGAAAASVAYLGLTAGGDLALAGETRQTIADGALIIVIVGVIVNFGAAQAYQRFNQANKEAVRESDRNDAILTEQEKHEKYFDKLVTADATSILEQMAPQMAHEKALAVAANWKRKEEAALGKFDGNPIYADNGRQGGNSGIGYSQPQRPKMEATGGGFYQRRRPAAATPPTPQDDNDGLNMAYQFALGQLQSGGAVAANRLATRFNISAAGAQNMIDAARVDAANFTQGAN